MEDFDASNSTEGGADSTPDSNGGSSDTDNRPIDQRFFEGAVDAGRDLKERFGDAVIGKKIVEGAKNISKRFGKQTPEDRALTAIKKENPRLYDELYTSAFEAAQATYPNPMDGDATYTKLYWDTWGKVAKENLRVALLGNFDTPNADQPEVKTEHEKLISDVDAFIEKDLKTVNSPVIQELKRRLLEKSSLDLTRKTVQDETYRHQEKLVLAEEKNNKEGWDNFVKNQEDWLKWKEGGIWNNIWSRDIKLILIPGYHQAMKKDLASAKTGQKESVATIKDGRAEFMKKKIEKQLKNTPKMAISTYGIYEKGDTPITKDREINQTQRGYRVVLQAYFKNLPGFGHVFSESQNSSAYSKLLRGRLQKARGEGYTNEEALKKLDPREPDVNNPLILAFNMEETETLVEADLSKPKDEGNILTKDITKHEFFQSGIGEKLKNGVRKMLEAQLDVLKEVGTSPNLSEGEKDEFAEKAVMEVIESLKKLKKFEAGKTTEEENSADDSADDSGPIAA